MWRRRLWRCSVCDAAVYVTLQSMWRCSLCNAATCATPFFHLPNFNGTYIFRQSNEDPKIIGRNLSNKVYKSTKLVVNIPILQLVIQLSYKHASVHTTWLLATRQTTVALPRNATVSRQTTVALPRNATVSRQTTVVLSRYATVSRQTTVALSRYATVSRPRRLNRKEGF